MSAQIYKKGNTHNVRGVTCELMNIDVADVAYYLKLGWVLKPDDLYDKAEVDPSLEETKVESQGLEDYSKTKEIPKFIKGNNRRK